MKKVGYSIYSELENYLSNIKERTLNFITDTSAKVPSSVFPGGADLSFSMYGDAKSGNMLV